MADQAKPTRKPPPRKPARPANLPHGRWLDDLEPLSKAERELVACCARGEPWAPEGWDRSKKPEEWTRPEEATEANRIRAAVIRFLALGGDERHPVHEHGVMCRGAWIDGELDLHQCRAMVRLHLEHCNFTEQPNFTAGSVPELALTGSRVPGLLADRLLIAGGLFLLKGFKSQGEVRLAGAVIGGTLDCSAGSFASNGANALLADGIKVTGGVFLNEGFAAKGEVRLLGAEIGGSLACNHSSFTNAGGDALSADGITVAHDIFLGKGFAAQGEVRLHGAVIGGDLACIAGSFANAGEIALGLQGCTITGNLFLRNAQIDGAVYVASARVGTLVDDLACWQAGGHVLDGLHYDRIMGPMDAAGRIAWLRQQRTDQLLGSEFKPQPWEQLIKVLRETGHSGEAAEVAIAKQEQRRIAGRVGQRVVNPGYTGWRRSVDAGWAWFSNAIAVGWHRIYGLLAGYGYKPQRIVYVMAAVAMLSSLAFYAGRQEGLIGPSNPLIHQNPALAHCGPDKANWTDGEHCPVPPEYSTFQPFFYSVDVILPLVDLHQEADWAPIVADSAGRTLWGGRLLRWLMWFEILFGWLASLMLVAILGRLVDKD